MVRKEKKEFPGGEWRARLDKIRAFMGQNNIASGSNDLAALLELDNSP
jgi:hypothetical protein